MTTAAHKPRRRRCAECDHLYPPDELGPSPRDGALVCEECNDQLAADSTPPDPADLEPPPSTPYSAEIALPFAQRNGDAPGDPEPASEPPFVPAPSTQVVLPALDLADEDERAERDWDTLPDVALPGWPLRRGRITASALGMFARCPEQFRQKYILGTPDPSGASALTGTALHKVIGANWRFKMAQGEDAPLAELERAFDDAFDGKISHEEERWGAVDWGHDGTKAKRPMSLDSWRARGREALGSYMLHVAVRTWPVSEEELFVVQVAGLPVPVVGFLDLRTDRAMVDVKFGKQKQSRLSPEWRIQGLTYLLAFDLPMEWHSINWKGEFHTPADSAGLILPRTAETYSIALDLIRSSVAGILAYADRFGVDSPWPGALTHTWACSTCSFEPSCPWWHRPFYEPTGALV